MLSVCYFSNIHVNPEMSEEFFSFEVPFAPLPFAAFSLKFYISQDAMEYAECEATVKSYPPFIEAMKRRGVDDMDLVMVDAW